MPKFVVYSGGKEVIVTTLKAEDRTIREYFAEGCRDIESYDREEIDDMAVLVRSNMEAL
jgi:hypothetical protein